MILNFNKKGFSLIEVLLAISLFSMVAAIIYGVFFSGIQLNQRSQSHNDVSRQAHASIGMIKKDLENMVNYNFENSYQNSRLAFLGTEHKLQLLLPTDEGLKIIRYYLADLQNSIIHKEIVRQVTKKNVEIVTGNISEERLMFLVREELDFIQYLSDDSFVGEVEILGSNIKNDGLNIEYYQSESELSTGWKKRWEEDYFPLLVRVRLDFIASEESFIDNEILIPTNNFKLILSEQI